MIFAFEKIRELRHEQGWSLEMMSRIIAGRLGEKISKSTVYGWETGRYDPGTRGLVILCLLFQVNPSYFFRIKPLKSA